MSKTYTIVGRYPDSGGVVVEYVVAGTTLGAARKFFKEVPDRKLLCEIVSIFEGKHVDVAGEVLGTPNAFVWEDIKNIKG